MDIRKRDAMTARCAPPDGAEPHWWDEPAAAFDAWLARQSDEVQSMTLLEQIEVYGDSPPPAATKETA